MNQTSDFKASVERETAKPGTGWQIVWGVLLILAGVLAVAMPLSAAIANAVILGILLVFGGVIELLHGFGTRHEKAFVWKLLSGILTLILGAAILIMPLAGIAALALMIGVFLFAGGVLRSLLAFQIKPLRGWGWVLFDGLLSLALGLLISLGWPQTSIPFIGLLTGFWLISAGLWRIAIARFLAV